MADFPNAFFSGRQVENRDGVSYDVDKTKVFFAEDINDLVNEVEAIEEFLGTKGRRIFSSRDELITIADTDKLGIQDESDTKELKYSTYSNLKGALKYYFDTLYNSIAQYGWFYVSDTWEYSSVDDPTGVLTVPSDATEKYSPGMRIRFMNDGNLIYGIITAVTSTSITFLHEIDPTDSQALYLMTDNPITAIYCSTQKAPFGFPLDPDKWTVETEDTSLRSQTPADISTWYNLGSISIEIPIGVWKVGYSVVLNCSDDSAGDYFIVYSTLSTANNSETDKDFTVKMQMNAQIGANNTSFQINTGREKILNLSTKDTYYLNGKSSAPSLGDIKFRGNDTPTLIRAVCVYL